MTVRLEGQRALVIGGSSGIGLATAEMFAARGATVVAASRNPQRTRKRAAAAGIEIASLDVLDERMISDFFAARDPFDHIVISAAVTKIGTVRELALQDARSAMDSKFWGAYLVARAAKLTGTGSLTLVSGLLGVRPSAGAALQGAINAALEALGRGLALELSPVRVNTISPGFIVTPVHDTMDPPDRARMFSGIVRSLPVGRIGQADEVAAAIIMAATNGFITGSTILVDGGGSIA